jgi:hypothetical protein
MFMLLKCEFILALSIKGRTEIERIWEQGAEVNIWTEEG